MAYGLEVGARKSEDKTGSGKKLMFFGYTERKGCFTICWWWHLG